MYGQRELRVHVACLNLHLHEEIMTVVEVALNQTDSHG